MGSVLTHLFAGGLGAVVHPVMGWLGKRSQFKHDETMERIGIDEVQAEAKAGVQVAAEATKTAVAKGKLALALSSYNLGVVHLPKGIKLPGWAGGLLAVSAFANGMIHPFILLCSFIGAAVFTWTQPDAPQTAVWTHALGATIGWSLGYHASMTAGWLTPTTDTTPEAPK